MSHSDADDDEISFNFRRLSGSSTSSAGSVEDVDDCVVFNTTYRRSASKSRRDNRNNRNRDNACLKPAKSMRERMREMRERTRRALAAAKSSSYSEAVEQTNAQTSEPDAATLKLTILRLREQLEQRDEVISKLRQDLRAAHAATATAEACDRSAAETGSIENVAPVLLPRKRPNIHALKQARKHLKRHPSALTPRKASKLRRKRRKVNGHRRGSTLSEILQSAMMQRRHHIHGSVPFSRDESDIFDAPNDTPVRVTRL